MTHSSAVGRTTLAFSAGSVGLATAFVLLMAVAVSRSNAPHGVPAATDYRFGAATLLLLIAGFFVAMIAGRRAALPTPLARTGFIAGIAGIALLLSVMMLIGQPLGMRGPLLIAVVAGLVSAAGAIRLARKSPPTEA